MAPTLKPIPDAHLDAFFLMLNDPTLAVHTGTIPHPITKEWAQKRLNDKRAAEAAGTSMDWGLYDDNILVGNAGWFLDEAGNVEIGYAIHKNHRGKGYATTAATLVLAQIRASGHKEPVFACYFTDNPASGRVLQKLGFVLVKEIIGTSVARAEGAPSKQMMLPSGEPRLKEGDT